MPTKHCCYGTCSSDNRYDNRIWMRGVYFITFPKPKSQPEKCARWLKACGRANFGPEKVTRNTFICSKHFVGGNGPTSGHPDPVPCEEIERIVVNQKRGVSKKVLAPPSSPVQVDDSADEQSDSEERVPEVASEVVIESTTTERETALMAAGNGKTTAMAYIQPANNTNLTAPTTQPLQLVAQPGGGYVLASGANQTYPLQASSFAPSLTSNLVVASQPSTASSNQLFIPLNQMPSINQGTNIVQANTSSLSPSTGTPAPITLTTSQLQTLLGGVGSQPGVTTLNAAQLIGQPQLAASSMPGPLTLSASQLPPVPPATQIQGMFHGNNIISLSALPQSALPQTPAISSGPTLQLQPPTSVNGQPAAPAAADGNILRLVPASSGQNTYVFRTVTTTAGTSEVSPTSSLVSTPVESTTTSSSPVLDSTSTNIIAPARYVDLSKTGEMSLGPPLCVSPTLEGREESDADANNSGSRSRTPDAVAPICISPEPEDNVESADAGMNQGIQIVSTCSLQPSSAADESDDTAMNPNMNCIEPAPPVITIEPQPELNDDDSEQNNDQVPSSGAVVPMYLPQGIAASQGTSSVTSNSTAFPAAAGSIITLGGNTLNPAQLINIGNVVTGGTPQVINIGNTTGSGNLAEVPRLTFNNVSQGATGANSQVINISGATLGAQQILNIGGSAVASNTAPHSGQGSGAPALNVGILGNQLSSSVQPLATTATNAAAALSKDKSPNSVFGLMRFVDKCVGKTGIESWKEFFCNFCLAKSSDERSFMDHVSSHLFVCGSCTYQTFSRIDLVGHIIRDHPNEKSDMGRLHTMHLENVTLKGDKTRSMVRPQLPPGVSQTGKNWSNVLAGKDLKADEGKSPKIVRKSLPSNTVPVTPSITSTPAAKQTVSPVLPRLQPAQPTPPVLAPISIIRFQAPSNALPITQMASTPSVVQPLQRVNSPVDTSPMGTGSTLCHYCGFQSASLDEAIEHEKLHTDRFSSKNTLASFQSICPFCLIVYPRVFAMQKHLVKEHDAHIWQFIIAITNIEMEIYWFCPICNFIRPKRAWQAVTAHMKWHSIAPRRSLKYPETVKQEKKFLLQMWMDAFGIKPPTDIMTTSTWDACFEPTTADMPPVGKAITSSQEAAAGGSVSTVPNTATATPSPSTTPVPVSIVSSDDAPLPEHAQAILPHVRTIVQDNLTEQERQIQPNTFFTVDPDAMMFTCKLCSSYKKNGSSAVIQMIEHIYQHFSIALWECSICGERRYKRNTLVLHLADVHPNQMPYQVYRRRPYSKIKIIRRVQGGGDAKAKQPPQRKKPEKDPLPAIPGLMQHLLESDAKTGLPSFVWSCPICHRKDNQRLRLQRHMGFTHPEIGYKLKARYAIPLIPRVPIDHDKEVEKIMSGRLKADVVVVPLEGMDRYTHLQRVQKHFRFEKPEEKVREPSPESSRHVKPLPKLQKPVSSKNGKWLCSNCDFRAKNVDIVKQHILLDHPKSEPIVIDKRTYAGRRRHIYLCPRCDFYTRIRQAIVNHSVKNPVHYEGIDIEDDMRIMLNDADSRIASLARDRRATSYLQVSGEPTRKRRKTRADREAENFAMLCAGVESRRIAKKSTSKPQYTTKPAVVRQSLEFWCKYCRWKEYGASSIIRHVNMAHVGWVKRAFNSFGDLINLNDMTTIKAGSGSFDPRKLSDTDSSESDAAEGSEKSKNKQELDEWTKIAVNNDTDVAMKDKLEKRGGGDCGKMEKEDEGAESDATICTDERDEVDLCDEMEAAPSVKHAAENDDRTSSAGRQKRKRRIIRSSDEEDECGDSDSVKVLSPKIPCITFTDDSDSDNDANDPPNRRPQEKLVKTNISSSVENISVDGIDGGGKAADESAALPAPSSDQSGLLTKLSTMIHKIVHRLDKSDASESEGDDKSKSTEVQGAPPSGKDVDAGDAEVRDGMLDDDSDDVLLLEEEEEPLSSHVIPQTDGSAADRDIPVDHIDDSAEKSVPVQLVQVNEGQLNILTASGISGHALVPESADKSCNSENTDSRTESVQASNENDDPLLAARSSDETGVCSGEKSAHVAVDTDGENSTSADVPGEEQSPVAKVTDSSKDRDDSLLISSGEEGADERSTEENNDTLLNQARQKLEIALQTSATATAEAGREEGTDESSQILNTKGGVQAKANKKPVTAPKKSKADDAAIVIDSSEDEGADGEGEDAGTSDKDAPQNAVTPSADAAETSQPQAETPNVVTSETSCDVPSPKPSASSIVSVDSPQVATSVSKNSTYSCPHCVWGGDSVTETRTHMRSRHKEMPQVVRDLTNLELRRNSQLYFCPRMQCAFLSYNKADADTHTCQTGD